MAREAGITMPTTRLINVDEKHRFFAIERFDRKETKRIHTHSLASLLHVDFRELSISYNDLLKVSAHLTKNRHDTIEIFRRMIFNAFAHNRDDHGKNFSFVMNPQGKWCLSSGYDITYSHGPHGYHSMDPCNGKRHPQRCDFESLAKEFSLKLSVLNEIIDRTRSAVSKWGALSKEYEVDQQLRREISEKVSVFDDHFRKT